MGALKAKGNDDPSAGVLELAHKYKASLQIQKPVFERFTGTHVGEQTKYVKVVFSDKQIKRWGKVELVQLTDVQFGHIFCNEKRLEQLIEWVLAKEYRFLLPTGDLIDSAHIGSPGGTHSNKWQPSIQLKRFCSLMARVAHRILGEIGGNHEWRQDLYFGDLGTMIATFLEVPYSSGQMYVDIYFGDKLILRNELWHGRGAAASDGGKINMIGEHMKQNPYADVIWVGHLHGGFANWKWVKTPHPGNMQVSLRKQVGVMSPSFLDFWGVYGEIKGLSPADVIISRVICYPDGSWELVQG